MDVDHDSTNNIMADVCLQKEDCLPKRKRFVPIMDEEKESYGHQQDVCLLAEWRSMMALCSVGGYWYGGKQREHFTVMRLTSVANVSIEPLGKFHGQHSNVNTEVSKNNVFIPDIRQASELCWVGVGADVQAVCPQVLAVGCRCSRDRWRQKIWHSLQPGSQVSVLPRNNSNKNYIAFIKNDPRSVPAK